MGQKNKTGMHRLVRQRDNAHSELEFDREYPVVQAALIDARNEKLLGRQELRAKKRLMPLELAAMPEAERNGYLREREMEKFREKQSLPRRAVEQEYLRRKEKRGEAAAESYRAAALEALDGAEQAKLTELKDKYPENASDEVPVQAADAYAKAAREEEERLTALRRKLEKGKAEKMNGLNARIEKRDQKLQARFDAANRRLRSMSPISEADFGPDNILCVRDLKMYFSGIKAVDGLDFEIRKGEIFGLIGPNGAGKTTVFNCITQFYKPTGGQVFYRDRFDNIVALTDYKTSDVIKTGISRTFQNLELVYYLSILDNMLIGVHAFYRASLGDQFLHTAKLMREENVFRQRAVSILERLGIAQYKDMLPMGLPYGVLKKVEMARTLMSNPRMIILDEPAAGLNDAETEELTEIIRLIRDDFNCTIFLVEHDMNLVMNVCDTICAISFGKMLAIGTPEEIQRSPLVQEAYLGTD